MSNDLRGLLQRAANVPTSDADVAGALRRGRRMRVQRRAMSGLAVVAVIAIASVAVANVLPDRHATAPGGPVTTGAPAVCREPGPTPALPAWTQTAVSASATFPHLVSADGNVAALLFPGQLHAGHPTNPANKILWVVRLPRDGKPLVITATLPGSDAKPVRVTKTAAGEIYPTNVDVPRAGCWHFALAWNGHHTTMNLEYLAESTTTTAPTTTPATTATTAPTTTSTAVPGATCQTATLHITISGPSGSAGHSNYEIAFRNDSASACSMTGFPGVSYLDGSGRQIGVPAQRNPVPFTPVALNPGATAYAHLSVTDPSLFNGCAGTQVAEVRIFPPNELHDATVPGGSIAICASQTSDSSTVEPVMTQSLG